MIDRLMRMIFELLVVLVLLGALIGALPALLREGCHEGATATRHIVPRLAGDVLVTLGTGLFVIGLGVRLHRAFGGRDSRAGRERASQERQARHAVRRHADDVPVEGLPEPPEDPDPALDLREDRHHGRA